MILNLTPLQKALFALEEAINNATDQTFVDSLSDSQQKLIISGVIKHFEFTYEIGWKMMKRWLEENRDKSGIEGVTRRELFRLAAMSGLISDVDKWMLYHQARNQTSHTYDENRAKEIFAICQQFLPEAEKLYQNLIKKND